MACAYNQQLVLVQGATLPGVGLVGWPGIPIGQAFLKVFLPLSPSALATQGPTHVTPWPDLCCV